MYRATEPGEQPSGQAQLPLWLEPEASPAVALRHSRRARRIAVRIMADGLVELVVPRGVPEHLAWRFLQTRSHWVRHQLARRRSLRPAEEAFPPRELRLPLLGERWRLFQSGGTGRARLLAHPEPAPPAAADRATLLAGGMLELRGAGGAADWRRCLMAWLKARALPALRQRLDAQAQRHGFSYSALSLRCQRTRWGSCSARGAISLNLALLFQSEAVVRYLLCHELSHTRHMNHSVRFWRCVAACEPDWRELDAALLQGWRHVPGWVLARA